MSSEVVCSNLPDSWIAENSPVAECHKPVREVRFLLDYVFPVKPKDCDDETIDEYLEACEEAAA
ncbi:MAG TPA: hypothetical protein VN519_06670 [Bryobacteraceae bacterium]|nr:hypothetical protein [Bryobacteraceae bacterium]